MCLYVLECPNCGEHELYVYEDGAYCGNCDYTE